MSGTFVVKSIDLLALTRAKSEVDKTVAETGKPYEVINDMVMRKYFPVPTHPLTRR